MRRADRLSIATLAMMLAACVAPAPPATSLGRLPACDDVATRTLAPTGTLRVAVYPGSPTSLVRLPDGTRAGLALALGDALARTLGVPAATVEFKRPAEVIEGLKAGQADLTFTNATAARARDVDFTDPLLRLELGVLVREGAALRSVEALDTAGLRVGVSRGSSSQAALGPRLRQATLVPVDALAEARQALVDGRLDAFATNKGILFELADQVPGARVLPGRWGLEHLALAVPKVTQGREAARACLAAFGASLRGGKLMRDEAARAGLRGLAED